MHCRAEELWQEGGSVPALSLRLASSARWRRAVGQAGTRVGCSLGAVLMPRPGLSLSCDMALVRASSTPTTSHVPSAK